MQEKSHKHLRLGEFASTAICGNDISSSVLYVSGLVIGLCGVYAPLVLLAVIGVLFVYQYVYREVVEALPVNGGAYNALLNSTTKKTSSIAGILTILSYIATVVISAKTAVEYLNTLLGYGNLFVLICTSCIMLLFAGLVILGVKDSAKVAIGIFTLHIATLIAFVILGGIYVFTHDIQFISHFTQNISLTHAMLSDGKTVLQLLFLGFAGSLLGVSGFESSANFVEEQERGVFKKTLRNMLIIVGIFNPLVAFLCLGFSDILTISSYKDFVLSAMGKIIGGEFFQFFIVIDAFLVLCGAVLTGYVGVSGLMNRMSLDDVLPHFFTKKNSNDANYVVVLVFFVLCTSILFVTKGNLTALAGVYGISFLCVMTMFAIGNLILKINRYDLKRTFKINGWIVGLAAFSTIAGVIGNIMIDSHNIVYFLTYFIPAVVGVWVYMNKHNIIKVVLKLTNNALIQKIYDRSINQDIALLVNRSEDIDHGLKYIENNESAKNIYIVHVAQDDAKSIVWENIITCLPALDKLGMFRNFSLIPIKITGVFGPTIVEKLHNEYHIQYNNMFMGSVKKHHHFEYSELHGIRIIM